MPTFIKGISAAISQVTSWLLFLVPTVGGLVLVVMGLQLMRAEGDGMEVKRIKDKMQWVLIGTGVAFGGTWIINWLAGLMRTGGGS